MNSKAPLALIAISTYLFAALCPRPVSGAESPIEFEDFPVSVPNLRLSPEIDVRSHPLAGKYQTVLRTEAREGPNFAGYFRIVQIGCGSNCAIMVIINLSNGAVYSPQAMKEMAWTLPDCKVGLALRPNSRLLIAYGPRGPDYDQPNVIYLEWTGADFRLLRSQRKRTASCQTIGDNT